MYSSRRRRKKPELNSNINITNLVDVVLTILIIFILVAPLIEKGIPIALPKSSTEESIKKPQYVIKVTKDEKIYFGEKRLTIQELERRLRSVAAVNPDIRINVQGAGGVNYQSIVKVLDIIRRSGITKVGLVTEAEVEK